MRSIKAKPFYDNLLKFMTSGPIVVQVLEGQDAIRRHRELLAALILRRLRRVLFVPIMQHRLLKMQCMVLDSPESAAREIEYFFTDDEICPRTR